MHWCNTCAIGFRNYSSKIEYKPLNRKIDNRGDGYFQKSWSFTIYPCQKMNSHGIMFLRVSPLKITGRDASECNSSVTWILEALLTQIEPLWRIVEEHHDLRTSMWHGWILRFLRNVFILEARIKLEKILLKTNSFSQINDFYKKSNAIVYRHP